MFQKLCYLQKHYCMTSNFSQLAYAEPNDELVQGQCVSINNGHERWNDDEIVFSQFASSDKNVYDDVELLPRNDDVTTSLLAGVQPTDEERSDVTKVEGVAMDSNFFSVQRTAALMLAWTLTASNLQCVSPCVCLCVTARCL